MDAGLILCLDLATSTGWCEGVPGGKPKSGTLRLGTAGASPGERFLCLFRALETRFEAFKPTWVVYEAALTPSFMRGKTNAQTTAFLMGLPAIVQVAARRVGIYHVTAVNVQDVRAHFIEGFPFWYRGAPLVGARRLPRAQAKHCVGERCRQLGHTPATEDEADAIAIWHWACAHAAPSEGWRRTALAMAAA